MAVTSIGFYVISRYLWGWPAILSAVISGVMLTIDLSFFGANALKFAHGGYIPVVIASVLFTVMINWMWGRRLVQQAYQPVFRQGTAMAAGPPRAAGGGRP